MQNPGKAFGSRATWLVPIIYHLLSFDAAKALRLLFDLGPLTGRPKYDVIHCHFGPGGEIGRRLRKIGALKGRLITTFYGYDITLFLKEHGEQVYYDLFREGDLFMYISDFIGEKLIHAGCPVHKSLRFRLGTDLRQFDFSERHVQPGEIIRLITVARLVEKKGLEYSIKAIAQLIKIHPVLRYDIVGEGPLHQELSHLIKQLEVEDKIKLLGWKNKDEVRALYAEAHIFLLTSVTSSAGDTEGQGVVLQEAQAMGLPVVCTNHNGFPESILPGQSGFLVPERDVDAIAHKISKLMEDPQQWAEVGRKGRRFVEREFDLNKRNDALVEVYQNLIRFDDRREG
jgi:colanic acid/amylovoran biosynthesis glycosyltransferase